MSYPSKILPNPSYKIIDCDLSSHYLVRSTIANNNADVVNSETGLVRVEHICSPREHAADLSCSLLGVFEIKHVQISLTATGKKLYNDYCEPNIDVDPPSEDHYIIDSSKLYWVVLVGSIHNVPVDYTKGDKPFTARCVVQHTPMKWNYWHFSIRWITENIYWHELPEKERSRLAKRLGHEARSLVSMFATTNEPNYSELDHAEYFA